VRLNSGSQLRYSQGYGIVDRKLVFSGEGYFKVHHNRKFPFLIETKGLALKDIGTEFNIRNYADDNYINVNLFHGSVEIHNKIHPSIPVLMSPGECLILDKRNGKIQKGECGVDMDSAFMMNDLNFIDMDMSDIAKQLTRSYGVDIEVANKVQHRRFYGFFNRKDDSLNEILKVISSTGLVRYTQRQGKYLIY
jgi:ferric-dicitrate binding protein FerR (iron transport regulator)